MERTQHRGQRGLRVSNGNRRQKSFRITDRDREILFWVARMRFATVDQIGRRFGMGRTAAYRRTQALREAGLLERLYAYLPEGPSIVLVTRRGLAVGGSRLSLPDVDVRQFVHDRELVEVAIDYELEGSKVYSDREIRSIARATKDTTGRYRFEVGFLRGHRRRYHYPDLIVEGPDSRIAVELEFADKGSRRLREILEGYCYSAREIDRVVYLVGTPTLAKRIDRIIGELTMRDRAEVRAYGERVR